MWLFGWGEPVEVFVAFHSDKSIVGIFTKRDVAAAHSRLPIVESWTIDMPELGPTRWIDNSNTPGSNSTGGNPSGTLSR